MTLLAMENDTEAQFATAADVHSKADCMQCAMTYRLFIELGIDIVITNVVENTEALARVAELGYMQAPVTITNDGNHWSGFDADRIKDYAAQLEGLVPCERKFAQKLVAEIKHLIKQGVAKLYVINGEIIVPEMVIVEDESELVA